MNKVTKSDFKTLVEQEFDFQFLDYSCGHEVTFIGADAKNGKDWNRKIKVENADLTPFWTYTRGFLNGYGKTLEEAKNDLQGKISTLPEEIAQEIDQYYAYFA